MLAGLELVGVHGQAHAAAGLPPLGARGEEDPVQALALGLVPDGLAAGDDERLHAGCGLAALEDSGPRTAGPRCGRWCTSR